jgi:hypothetical protein
MKYYYLFLLFLSICSAQKPLLAGDITYGISIAQEDYMKKNANV